MINQRQIVLAIFLFIFSHSSFATTSPIIQLATPYQLTHNIQKYWISEKLDGVRGYWNGKAMLTKNGNVISVPAWFTKGWPDTVMDGELWIKRQSFEQVLSCVSRLKASLCWKNIKFMMFDLPQNEHIFTERIIQMKALVKRVKSPYLEIIPQFKLSSQEALNQKLNNIVKQKGEGLMLHYGNAIYTEGKTHNIMKLKPYQQGYAVVLEHIEGNRKYKTMLGSIKVRTSEGIDFKIGTGFSDAERKSPPPLGSTIVFKHIGKTQKGVPKFASFLRVKSSENIK